MDESAGPEALPEQAIKTVLDALGEGPLREEFVEGLDKRVHFVLIDPSAQHRQDLQTYLRHWVLDLVASRSAAWTAQVEESERRLQAGDLGEPIDAAGLRSLLTSR